MVLCIGPLATIRREPRQARKGAAAAVDSGAGMRLMRSATQQNEPQRPRTGMRQRAGLERTLRGKRCVAELFRILPASTWHNRTDH